MHEHLRKAVRALVSTDIQRALTAHEARYGKRPVVRLTVTQYLSLLGAHVLDLSELKSRSARTAHNFRLAAEDPGLVPGWHVEIDNNARKPRLKCTRTTTTSHHEPTPTASS